MFMMGSSSPMKARVTRLEARVGALESRQGVQAARTRVLFRALEQSSRAPEYEADGTIGRLEMLAKVLDPDLPPQK